VPNGAQVKVRVLNVITTLMMPMPPRKRSGMRFSMAALIRGIVTVALAMPGFHRRVADA
jgi:hypothetical protein